MGQSTANERDTELFLAARNGDPWARDQLAAAHLPLVHDLVASALDDAAGVEHVVRETMLRALDGLHALSDPGALRPWLVAIALDGTRAHRHAHGAGHTPAYGQDPELDRAVRWLEPDDAELLALWRLERTGRLVRHETAAALRWTVEDTAIRIEALRSRLDAARVVAAALTDPRPCPALAEQAAGWDGVPSAPWRDHLAHHTAVCGRCAGGWSVLVPVEALLAGPPAPPSVPMAAVADAPLVTAGERRPEPPAEPELAGGPVADAGRRGTRAARRRRRQAQERGRRRVVVAAGVAVMAVTGGAFSLSGGRGERDELLEGNRVAASGPDVAVAHDPTGLSTTPATATAPPSSASPAASAATSASPGRKTPSAAPSSRAATPAATKPAAAPTRASAPTRRPTSAPPATTAPDRGGDSGTGGSGAGHQSDPGRSSAADQVIALVNEERAKAGCGPLVGNATLTRAAQGHSDDMAARDFFDHTNPDGDGPGERVTAAGYPWSTYGENIAMGQTTPEQVMEAWMNSPGHRANILNCSFKEIGIGLHTEGGPYWTQVFGAR